MHGVYGRVRHPMYAALLMASIGLIPVAHNWVLGPAMLGVAILFVAVRAPHEERFLLAQFGDPYRTYMTRTGRVLPRLIASSRLRKGLMNTLEDFGFFLSRTFASTKAVNTAWPLVPRQVLRGGSSGAGRGDHLGERRPYPGFGPVRASRAVHRGQNWKPRTSASRKSSRISSRIPPFDTSSAPATNRPQHLSGCHPAGLVPERGRCRQTHSRCRRHAAGVAQHLAGRGASLPAASGARGHDRPVRTSLLIAAKVEELAARAPDRVTPVRQIPPVEQGANSASRGRNGTLRRTGSSSTRVAISSLPSGSSPSPWSTTITRSDRCT